jgi:hypothetical protein
MIGKWYETDFTKRSVTPHPLPTPARTSPVKPVAGRKSRAPRLGKTENKDARQKSSTGISVCAE